MKSYRIFVDTETTHTDPALGELLQVAIVREEITEPWNLPGRIVSTLNAKILPTHLETADPEALVVNGYSPEAWADAKPFKDVAGQIVDICRNATWIGHNPTFDRTFILKAFAELGRVPRLQKRLVDTVSLAYSAWGLDGELKLSMENLREYLHLTSANPHDALNDALDCREVFYRAIAPRKSFLSRLWEKFRG